ncbi:hypothetical protein QBC33DRAFT_2837 [Phialemonium atrogriseum]|uniref:C2H2-type domain-containing protein n=1 Tax=Phialemonium atrogriseum TaxID=1093897 RepID=A0AAJ0FTL0_9PEZI|nr:uncharacterized protein QBC33DRAFT_2837 [Phialemonium atrogriseum]KAK1772260.1 hypothetical protein QBC33DRAFT_2837 [Phialemonium atrogriseum]
MTNIPSLEYYPSQLTQEQHFQSEFPHGQPDQQQISSAQPAAQSSNQQAQGSGVHTCESCGIVFRRPCELGKHAKTHKPAIKCPADKKCAVVKAEQRDMNRHLWVSHSGYAKKNEIPPIETAVCPHCKRGFSRKDNFQKHLRERRCKGQGNKSSQG